MGWFWRVKKSVRFFKHPVQLKCILFSPTTPAVQKKPNLFPNGCVAQTGSAFLFEKKVSILELSVIIVPWRKIRSFIYSFTLISLSLDPHSLCLFVDITYNNNSLTRKRLTNCKIGAMQYWIRSSLYTSNDMPDRYMYIKSLFLLYMIITGKNMYLWGGGGLCKKKAIIMNKHFSFWGH